VTERQAEGELVALVIATAEIEGGPLALERWGERSVLEHVLETVRAAGLDRVVVVVGPAAEVVVKRTEFDDAVIVIDPEWSEGPAASVRCALDELTRTSTARGALVVDVAQPQMVAEVIEKVAAGWEESDAPAAIIKYRYATGLPLVIHRDLWPRIMGLEGEATPEALLKAHAEWVQEVWVDSLAPRTITSAKALATIAPRG